MKKRFGRSSGFDLMIFKIITLFLVGMAVLAMFGKLKFPKVGPKLGAKTALKCSKCGSYRIGKGPCPCQKKG
ncbi:hypothetical protein BDE40_2819 [Litoreibacter halocynthiae]|uniref:Uncharacterized protein n=1 Tax=Litoreibacter halocynthiae TaxID=1242689 RepID=A0A4R7LFF0_9RHOB|nr:hypothetical protein BDE40_2819 [Litoreibacter halocynthiae]